MKKLENICIISLINAKPKEPYKSILPTMIMNKVNLLLDLKQLQEMDLYLLHQKITLQAELDIAEKNTIKAAIFFDRICKHTDNYGFYQGKIPKLSPRNTLHIFWKRKELMTKLYHIYRKYLNRNENRRMVRDQNEEKLIAQLGQDYKVLFKFNILQ